MINKGELFNRCIDEYNDYFGYNKESEPNAKLIDMNDLEKSGDLDYCFDHLSTSHNNCSSVTVLSLYGLCIGKMFLDGKEFNLEKQKGMKQSKTFISNCNEILNINDEDDLVWNIADYLTDPNDNLLIFDEIIEKSISKIIKHSKKFLNATGGAEVSIILPPVSIEFSKLSLVDFLNENLPDHSTVKFEDLSCLADIDQQVKNLYLGLLFENNNEQIVIVARYRIVNDHKVCDGILSFKFEDEYFDIFQLRKFKTISMTTHKKMVDNSESGKTEDLIEKGFNVERHLPNLPGYLTFLNNHASRFYEQNFEYLSEFNDEYNLFSILEEDVQITPLGVYIMNYPERKTNEIAIGDLLFIANIMEQKENFQKCIFDYGRKPVFGSSKNLKTSEITEEILDYPISIFSSKWRLSKNNSELEERLRGGNDTESIANEMLFNENSRADIDSSAINSIMAFVSLKKSKMLEQIEIVDEIDNYDYRPRSKSVLEEEIEEKNYISIPISDLDIGQGLLKRLQNNDINNTEQLQQMTKLEVRQTTSIGQNDMATLCKALMAYNIELEDGGYLAFLKRKRPLTDSFIDKNKRKRLDISKISLSVRTYNALSRAGVQYIESLEGKEFSKLKIRNLGRKSVNEINEILSDYGYKRIKL